MSSTPAVRAFSARRLGAAVTWTLVIGLLVCLWPSSLGGCTTLTVITGQSMQPTLQPGDLAVLRCGDPAEGDVVAYRPFPDEAALVIHRIIGGDGVAGWRLQGDNNNFVDPFSPVASQVRGSLVFSVHGVGGIFGALGLPWIWGSAFLLAGALMWLSAGKREDEPDPVSDVDTKSGDGQPQLEELPELLEV